MKMENRLKERLRFYDGRKVFILYGKPAHYCTDEFCFFKARNAGNGVFYVQNECAGVVFFRKCLCVFLNVVQFAKFRFLDGSHISVCDDGSVSISRRKENSIVLYSTGVPQQCKRSHGQNRESQKNRRKNSLAKHSVIICNKQKMFNKTSRRVCERAVDVFTIQIYNI